MCIQAVVVFKAFQEKGQEPDWANLLFWLTVAFPIVLMPGWWFYLVCTQSQVSLYSHNQGYLYTCLYMHAQSQANVYSLADWVKCECTSHTHR